MPPPVHLPDVLALLPHRYPFLLLDEITAVEPGRRAEGIKRVTGAEWASGAPAGLGTVGVMPHTLVLEALAQLSGAVLAGLTDGAEGVVGYFLGVDRVRFRGVARAGDAVLLEVTLKQFRRGVCRTHGVARVDGLTIVRADMTTIVRAGAA